MKKKLLSFLLAAAMCFGMIPLSAAAADDGLPFTDLDKEKWYMDAIQYVYDNKLMNGTNDGSTFEPDTTLSRAMFVTILGRMAGVAEDEYTSSAFTDVKSGEWYTSYVEWARVMGIAKGTSEETLIFGVDDPVSRQEMATFVERYVNTMGYTLLEAENQAAAFIDADEVASWAVDAVEMMRKSGILQGDENSAFHPADYADRAQAAAVFMRLDMAVKSLTEKAENAYTNLPLVRLHTEPATASPAVDIPYMSELTILGSRSSGQTGTWYEVSYDEEIYYLWVSAGEYDTMLTSQKSSFTYTGNTEIQQEIIDTALYIYNHWTTGYRQGQGAYDSTGVPDEDGVYWFDCSGFAAYVINSVMQQYIPVYYLSRSVDNMYAAESLYNQGYNQEFTVIDVEISELQPGDILFFNLEDDTADYDADREVTHCGIYLGNGEFIHCSRSWGGGVCIMPLKGTYSTNFVAAKRYVPDAAVPANQTLYTQNPNGGTITYVRSEMSSDSEELTRLQNGTPVTLLYYNNGNWTYVEYEDGKYGYILKRYLVDSID